ncbi:hypothetical protein [Amnibacterium soli]
MALTLHLPLRTTDARSVRLRIRQQRQVDRQLRRSLRAFLAGRSADMS